MAGPLPPLGASHIEAWRGQYRGPCQEIQLGPCWARACGEGRALRWESHTADRFACCRSWWAASTSSARIREASRRGPSESGEVAGEQGVLEWIPEHLELNALLLERRPFGSAYW